MSSPAWERVEDWLRRGYEYGGGMELVAGYPETDTRTRHGVSINMSANPNECRLTYSPIQPSGEKTRMREWWEVGDLTFRGTTVFNDHPFDDRTVCRDVEIAVRIFKDFFDNHDLTEASLGHFISVWDAKPRSYSFLIHRRGSRHSKLSWKFISESPRYEKLQELPIRRKSRAS